MFPPHDQSRYAVEEGLNSPDIDYVSLFLQTELSHREMLLPEIVFAVCFVEIFSSSNRLFPPFPSTSNVGSYYKPPCDHLSRTSPQAG